MKRSSLFALLAASLVLAGCMSKGEPTPAAAVNSTEPTSALKLEMLPTGSPLKTSVPTLDSPPQWRSGEWWSVRLTDAFDHKTFEAKRVVAGKELDKYLVGMPREAFSNELMVLHMPGFGQIGMNDLSFDVHNVAFQPVKFPLTEGLKWDTKFEGRTFHAIASVKSPTLAEVDFTNDAKEHMHLTYDATIGEVTKFVFDNYATYEVTGHGYDYQGIVTVPHMFHLVFQQSRTGPVLAGSTPKGPQESVNVDTTFDRVSFVILAGSFVPFLQPSAPDAAAGYYKETVTGPDGKTYEMQVMPSETGLKTAYFMVDKPGGIWSFQHVVGGPGIVVAEGIAYHVYDIELPSGHILPSLGAHKHGG